MDRRTYLASGTLAAAALAGCSADALPLGGPTDLSGPERQAEDDETYHVYRVDGDRLLVVGALYQTPPAAGAARLPFRLHVWHAEDTHVDDLSYTIRCPAGDPNGQVPLYLERPSGSPWPDTTFERGAEINETVLELSNLDLQGEGSITLSLLAEAGDRAAVPVAVDYEVSLSGDGGPYRADDSLSFTLGTGD
ncbi:MAG: hypothetical protein ABEJ89_04365 [Haloarculaceae archaeon]